VRNLGMKFLCSLALGFSYAPTVAACPLCHSETGALVRAGIFNGDFTRNVLLAGLPFIAFALIALLVHFGFPRSLSPRSNGERK
jgi:hypothetical protein